MRWFGWFRSPETKPEEPLKPGVCQCSHNRSTHVGGKGKCKGEFPPDEEMNYWTDCACQIFILDKDNGGDDTPEPSPDPAVKELERMLKR